MCGDKIKHTQKNLNKNKKHIIFDTNLDKIKQDRKEIEDKIIEDRNNYRELMLNSSNKANNDKLKSDFYNTNSNFNVKSSSKYNY